MHRSLRLVIAVMWIGVGGCDSAPAPEAQETRPTRADSVGIALQTFDPAAFDTIAWESEKEAVERGRLVYRISCAKCHGNGGTGDGNFTIEGDTVRPPSFLGDDWRFANSPTDLRRYIFSGNVAGMPYWGLVGLKYRDIDAVARLVEGPLRTGVWP